MARLFEKKDGPFRVRRPKSLYRKFNSIHFHSMSFLEAANSIISSKPTTDHLRITLEVMIRGGHVGSANPITQKDLITALSAAGVSLTPNKWQTTVLKSSRVGSCFIGSGNRGYFIIDTIGDAEVMRDFYTSRIKSERGHLKNLKDQANVQGWTI